MNILAKPWKDVMTRLDALSLRERVLIFTAAACALLAALVFGVILPAAETAERLDAESVRLAAQTRQLEAQQAATGTPSGARPAQPDLAQHEARSLAAQGLAEAVRRLVQAQARVRLVELALSPPQPLLAEVATAAEAAPMGDSRSPIAAVEAPPGPSQSSAASPAASALPQWYAHPIRLELEGGYAELVTAVQALERLPGLVEWRSLRLDASAHPRIRMVVEIASIEKEAGWRKP